ncbi:hypothetical protein Dimus_013852 [Dionaea muscipula]
MNENGLNDVMNLIKRQKWERLFRRRELMHIDTYKEFYANLTMFHYKKHEVARSRDVWEEFKYIKPLETTGRFANDEMITEARRVKSTEMKPFQRRRDDEEATPAKNEKVNEEEVQQDFDWEAVIDEAALQGESRSGEKFYDVEDEVQESAEVSEDVPDVPAPAPVQ